MSKIQQELENWDRQSFNANDWNWVSSAFTGLKLCGVGGLTGTLLYHTCYKRLQCKCQVCKCPKCTHCKCRKCKQ